MEKPRYQIVVLLFFLIYMAPTALGQNRGVYPLGMSALNSGITPEPGFTYANQLLFYSRDKVKDDQGDTQPVSGGNDVLLDLNSFIWVADFTLPGGGRYSATATIPIAKNRLTSDIHGDLSGGSGLGDSYFMPLILGWTRERFAIRAIYGILAPTGRFEENASDNVGSGYWTHTISSGQTFYLFETKSISLSFFELYEWHSKQKGTDISPGQTLNVDSSVLANFSISNDLQMQLGLVGYLQRQTSANRGPGLTSEEKDKRYAVNALGPAFNLVFPGLPGNLGFRYFREFDNRSTFEGYSLQMAGSMSF